MFMGIWICLLCMKAASHSLLQRAETVSVNSYSNNYMQIIFSAVDDSEEGILGNTLSRFFCRESLPK